MSRARQGIKLDAFSCAGLARVGQLTREDRDRLARSAERLEHDDQLRVEIETFLKDPGPVTGEALSEAIDHLNHVEVGDNIRRQTGE